MGLISFVFTNTWTFLGSCLALYLLKNAFNELLASPLRTVPGPWYAGISEAWLTTHVFRFRQCRAVQELFEEYGPVVRIAPNKVAYCDQSSNKRIYMNTRFDKGPFYKGLLTNDNDHAMTCLEHNRHAPRRRAYAAHYTPANVALFQPEMHKCVLDTVEVLENIKGKNSVDVLHLFREMLVDLICAASFAYDVGALKARLSGSTEDHWLVRAIDDFPKRGIMRSLFPVAVWDKLDIIPSERWRLLYNSDKIIANFVTTRVAEARAQMQGGKFHEVEKVPLVHRLLESSMPEKDVVSEHMGHFIAGVDTSSTLTSYTLWELSRRPDISRKLRAELDTAMPDPKTIPDIAVLNSLPYLNAVVRESFRVYGSGPSLLERVVPSEGMELLGCNLPAGTIVATQSWSLHRSPHIFPSPETYLPDRWIDADEEQAKEMEAHLMPFGYGLRLCAGHHFANQLIRIALATFVRNFDVVAPPETNERSMYLQDAFVSFPAGMACKLIMVPRRA